MYKIYNRNSKIAYFQNEKEQENIRGQRETLPVMGLSLKLFIDWLTNGSVFSETSALR